MVIMKKYPVKLDKKRKLIKTFDFPNVKAKLYTIENRYVYSLHSDENELYCSKYAYNKADCLEALLTHIVNIVNFDMMELAKLQIENDQLRKNV